MLEGNKTYLENIHFFSEANALIFHRSTTLVGYVAVAIFLFSSGLHKYLHTWRP